jgi:hypothetical protein
MNRIRAASAIYFLLAAHVVADGSYPLLNGWKVKLETVPFFVGGALLFVTLLLLIAPSRTRALGFAVACACAALAAVSIIVPLVLDGDFAPGAIHTLEVNCLVSCSLWAIRWLRYCLDAPWPLTNCCKRLAKTLALEQYRYAF